MLSVCKQLASALICSFSLVRPTMVMPCLETVSPSPSSSKRGTSTMAKSRSIIREEEGDLFRASRQVSLAHCVSSDMKMGAGIALYFRQKFGRVEDLLEQKKSVGDVAYLKDGQRFIFYLVTKKRFYDKPTESTLHLSLLVMKDMCNKFGVTRLAMPRIGCGLDGLKWPLVSQIIQEVFSDCGMQITIYSIPDRGFKTLTPTLSKSKERFRNFFDTRKTHSLPASEMTSKRKFHMDSSEEESETPKKRKKTRSDDKRNLITGDEFDIQPTLEDSSNSFKTSLRSPLSSQDHYGSSKFDNSETASQHSQLSHSSGESPLVSSPQKSETSPPQHINPSPGSKFQLPLSHMAKANEIPFLTDQDEDEGTKIKHLNSDIDSAPAAAPSSSHTSTLRKSKSFVNHVNSGECLFSSKKIRPKPSASDSEEDSVLQKPVKKSSKSKSERSRKTPSPTHRKSRLISDYMVKSRRSSSSSRQDKKKTSSSGEKVTKEKKQKSSVILARRSLDSSLSRSYLEMKESVVSTRFPPAKKKTHLKELISSSDEDEESLEHANGRQNQEHKDSSVISSSEATSDEDIKSRKQLKVKKESRYQRPSEYFRGSDERTSPEVKWSTKESSVVHQKKGLPDRLKGRLGEVVKSCLEEADKPKSKKVKGMEYQSLNIRKDAKKLSKFPIGTMYSDRESSRSSVKDRLSLGRKS